MSAARNDERVANIGPPGRIQTVEVEVEPNVAEGDEESISEQRADQEKDGSATEQAAPSSSPTASVPTPPPTAQSPQAAAQTVPFPPNSAGSTIKSGGISPLPPPTFAEGLEEAGRKATKKKSGKAKPLSGKDLIPLHQDIGRSTKQLVEPSTPDFKPTAEWVCSIILCG